MYLEDVHPACQLAGVPGLAFPVGFDEAECTIGMQLMGPQFSEQVLFRTAAAYQSLTDWHQRFSCRDQCPVLTICKACRISQLDIDPK
jgi:aspartyl-tRNA(Asn)/glutamyl-tRNA(Gln) amidotransferase subunit A